MCQVDLSHLLCDNTVVSPSRCTCKVCGCGNVDTLHETWVQNPERSLVSPRDSKAQVQDVLQIALYLTSRFFTRTQKKVRKSLLGKNYLELGLNNAKL